MYFSNSFHKSSPSCEIRLSWVPPKIRTIQNDILQTDSYNSWVAPLYWNDPCDGVMVIHLETWFCCWVLWGPDEMTDILQSEWVQRGCRVRLIHPLWWVYRIRDGALQWNCSQVMQVNTTESYQWAGIILCMCPANERQLYDITASLIGRAYSQNDPWMRSQHWFW